MSHPSRRAFLGTLGAAAVALPEFGSHTIRVGADLSAAAPAAGQAAATYDLLIKGGRVLDASQKLNGALDVAIAGGKIAAVAANIPANRAKQVFDASGKLVTPGLVNVHAHVYRYVYPISVDPDAVGLPAGVTTGTCSKAGRSVRRRLHIQRGVTPSCSTVRFAAWILIAAATFIAWSSGVTGRSSMLSMCSRLTVSTFRNFR